MLATFYSLQVHVAGHSGTLSPEPGVCLVNFAVLSILLLKIIFCALFPAAIWTRHNKPTLSTR